MLHAAIEAFFSELDEIEKAAGRLSKGYTAAKKVLGRTGEWTGAPGMIRSLRRAKAYRSANRLASRFAKEDAPLLKEVGDILTGEERHFKEKAKSYAKQFGKRVVAPTATIGGATYLASRHGKNKK
jgi:hypothetical protein